MNIWWVLAIGGAILALIIYGYRQALIIEHGLNNPDEEDE